MVTAENGTVTFVGASGKFYSLSIYSSDVLGAYLTMSSSGLAGTGSQSFWNTPEQVTLYDISMTTGNTVTTVFRFQVNDVDVGNIVAEANILNTLANRSFPHITIGAGRKFTIIQA